METVTPRIRQLVGDMLETMYDACGVGLAAPQVGILKRIVVIDTDGEHPHILINPEILETSGSQTGDEGCLSLPGKTGTVTRPNYVKVRAMDLDMQSFELEATELLARAVCHECDHLDGIMLHAACGRPSQGRCLSGGRRGRMRVIFMGTPDFSVGALKALAENGYEIAGGGDPAG